MSTPPRRPAPPSDGPRVVILGPPGSGKGTYARELADRFDIPHLSTGAMLRREMERGSPTGRRVAAAVDAGELVPDREIVDLVRAAVASDAAARGWILDGAPRSLEQAELLAPVIEAPDRSPAIAVALDVPEAELRRRLAARGEREGRADDASDVVEHRLKVWAETGPPLLTRYEQRGLLSRVDGVGSIQEVAARVIEAVERRVTR